MPSKTPPSIHLIAGVNGAGKSSIQGAAILEAGGSYYNPDEAARKLMTANRILTQTEANSIAWHNSVELLRKAIQEKLVFVFESTLGGTTIPILLIRAAAQGIAVHVWFVGLESPELHIARVRQRVRRGGHFIPEEDIRRRYERSRLNLIDLIPQLASLRVFDNSFEADLNKGESPKLVLVLHMETGKIIGPSDLTNTPASAKAIVAAAIKYSQSQET
ncbi:MAG TPA: zeta toxin family protein [Pyrinomonadaceae bacterium]|jgi:predicted ABC-type ATPase|nr:zeta toxin family protein [Pyrinomonadaceae bacterium]